MSEGRVRSHGSNRHLSEYGDSRNVDNQSHQLGRGVEFGVDEVASLAREGEEVNGYGCLGLRNRRTTRKKSVEAIRKSCHDQLGR